MIDKFSMIRRVASRLEKFVFDRVWNDPYMEYRTNTRPRILNGTAKVSGGVDADGNELDAVDAYTPASGVFTGAFEQIALPDTGQAYYVYFIEANQFRSINLNATTWTLLSEYCTKSLVDLQVYSDSGVFLWRGGIYIKQDAHDARILVAVDAEMLHRCLDVYTKRYETKYDSNNEPYQEEFIDLTKRADPSAIFFTKYVDSDMTADNVITCSQVSYADYLNIQDYGVNPVGTGHSIAFLNGRVVTGNSYKNNIQQNDYIETVDDIDVIADITIDMESGYPSYTNSNGKERVLIHIPLANNPDKYLISYNTCDFYLIPKAISDDRTNMGFTPGSYGMLLHLCNREKYFIQLTHNDFAIDVSFLNKVAAAAGYPNNKYILHVMVRHHDKKLGLTRDANYCDMLYTYSHDDEKIVKFLLDDSELHTKWNMNFWTAKYLEDNGAYAQAMIQRVGSTLNAAAAEQYLRPTTDKYYQAGKLYYQMDETDDGDVVWSVMTPEEGDPIPEGISEYIFISNTPSVISGLTEGQEIPTGALEKVARHGLERRANYTLTTSGMVMSVQNQCSVCQLASRCVLARTQSATSRRPGNAAEINSYICPDFSYRSIEDYIKIFGYYHVLSLICKRVTTYKVTEAPRQRIINMTVDADGNPVPVYASEDTIVTVHVPLALYDLGHTAGNMEFYAMVYHNGVKLDDANVEITGCRTDKAKGLTELHFTYTPAFDDEIFWETDKDLLEITITPTEDNPITINKGDFITVEILPSTSDQETLHKYSDEFEITESTDDLSKGLIAFSPIGSSFGERTGVDKVVRMSSDFTYINGKLLIPGIDYTAYSSYPDDSDSYTFKPIVQNVSYLTETEYNLASGKYKEGLTYFKRRGRYMSEYDLIEDVPIGEDIPEDSLIYVSSNNLMEVITTTDKMIAYAKGFLVGNWINWDGIAPFWLDNLSVLIVGGKVCSYFSYNYSGLHILDSKHDNGEPYFVRTCVPESVLELINAPTYENLDKEHLEKLRTYFDSQESALSYRAIIPYSHKLYSTYLLAIVKDFLAGDFTFEMLKDPTAFKAQFAAYESLKTTDVVYNSINANDLKFVDVYPTYHNLVVADRYLKRKIAYMFEMLSPTDEIRHREHVNEH